MSIDAIAIEAARDARADLEALAAVVDRDGAPAQLLGGSPQWVARRLDEARPAAVRAASALESAPRAHADALEAADAVWVPGAFSRDALLRAGVEPVRVHVVAPVIDAARFTPDGPVERDPVSGGFVFLALVDWTRASGWDVLLRAWAKEFSHREDVTLVLRAYSSERLPAALIGEMVLAELDELGIDPAKMADFVLETSPAQAEAGPEVYRGADCFVSPARADAWGRRLLEAMACGVPVIASDWGAGADLVAPGTGFQIPVTVADVDQLAARELPELDGGRWGEPDEDRLRLLMRAVAADPGFAAKLGTRARAVVLERYAAGAPVSAPAAAAAPRVVVRERAQGARPEDISFVVQGPIERTGVVTTERACASVRAHFPGAEIVVSTWEGTDVSGLDFDRVVFTHDPGPVPSFGYNFSTNRLVVSSLAGIRAATRPLVVKFRSDLLFRSDAVLEYWNPPGRWPRRSDELRLFDQRVLVPNVFTRRPSSLNPRPLHPSDWAVLGTREDLERMFDIPAMTAADAGVKTELPLPTGLYHPSTTVPRATPEQWIWMNALRKADRHVEFAHHFDLTPDTLRTTELGFANNLVVLDAYTQFGIWCPKYTFPNRMFQDPTLVQHEDWQELYDVYCGDAAIEVEEVDAQLRLLARGNAEGLTHEDARLLRRAGLSWEAQLLECVLLGGNLRRDSTTGAHKWHLDGNVVRYVAEELYTLAAERVQATVKALYPLSALTAAAAAGA